MRDKCKSGTELTDINGNKVPHEKEPKFKCHCGFKGTACELVEPDVDGDLTCPRCYTVAWEWI